jgi:hypothetical protein
VPLSRPQRLPSTGSQKVVRGTLVDRLTQQWVRTTGRHVSLDEFSWLQGPVGDVDRIGVGFFERLAQRNGWTVIERGPRGLLDSFTALAGVTCEPALVAPAVVRFYERTSEYDLDAWSEWSTPFRPFGTLLSAVFSKRLEQLNVPLSPLDTKLGMTSRVVRLVSREGQCVATAWVRESVATRQTIYAGSYSHCRVPGFDGACIRVAFPLPNGYALVIMKPESRPDGSLTLRSEGTRFGDPGFYFFVETAPGKGSARYVASMKEQIHVFTDARGELRADHDLHIWGARFLRLHYRMRHRAGEDS